MRGGRLAGPALVAAFAAFGLALVVTAGPRSLAARAMGRTPAEPAPGSGRTSLEDAAVTAASGPVFRPATSEDAVESEGRQDLYSLYGDYSPYFVRGDLNSDGRLDFAQAFVRREGPEPLFDVAVFFGGADGFSAPVWVDRSIPLSTGDLSLDRSILIVTEDVEEDVLRRWRWDPAPGRFVDVDEGEGKDGEEPWTEPGGQLGTTA